VFGRNEAAFRRAVLDIVRTHFPEFGDANLAERLSREEHYLSMTLTVWVETQSQLDALYTELSAHDAVLMAL
jgi:putative lipoic acid-binding regulatory protein